ncbi:Rrf2 family transcriptional regulator [Halomonas sp. WWR20]
MHITRYTDYSLRVLIFVALKGEERSTISEIADHYSISRNHLMKIVHDLTRRGYLLAIRGKHGGLLLKGRPEDINLGKLIRDTEQDFALAECFSEGGRCVITPACRLKIALSEALNAFFQVLDGYTLGDLLESSGWRRSELLSLLQLPTEAPSPT